jgi:ligand-binding sensor domain-containing protein
MDNATSKGLTLPSPESNKIVLRSWKREIALRDLPSEELFPAVHSAWKTFASFRHVNALAVGKSELWAATWGGVVRWRLDKFGNCTAYTRFASEHGLPGINFTSIVLDEHGYPWVGGKGTGLVFFDGYAWKNLALEDGLPSNDVLCLFSGNDEKFWVTTSRGIGYVTTENTTLRWHDYPQANCDLPSGFVSSIVVDSNGILWMGTDWGLYRCAPDQSPRRYTTAQGLPITQVSHLALSCEGQLWIGTPLGICLLSGDTIQNFPNLTFPVRGIVKDTDSAAVWIVMPKGIAKVAPDGQMQIESPIPILPDTALIRAIAIGPSGRKWVGYTSGLVQDFPLRFLISDGGIDMITLGENSICNCISAIKIDDLGRVWIGTPEGLWYLEKGVWRACRPKNELSTHITNVRAIVSSPTTKEIWVGCWSDDNRTGLRRFVGTTEVPLSSSVPGFPHVDALTFDRNGSLWVAMDEHIYKYNGQDWSKVPSFADADFFETIHSLIVDESGTLWCGTMKGLWRFDGIWHKEKIDASVYSILSVGNKELIGTNQGLFQISKTAISEIELHQITDFEIRVLILDSDGIVWIGTQSGLIKLSGQEHTFFTTKDGLANNSIQTMTLGEGKLWIGTSNGLNTLDLEKRK